jgi:hypothetical protein
MTTNGTVILRYEELIALSFIFEHKLQHHLKGTEHKSHDNRPGLCEGWSQHVQALGA